MSKETTKIHTTQHAYAISGNETFELQIDFSNSYRRHTVVIKKGDTKQMIVAKLRQFANQIDDDEELS